MLNTEVVGEFDQQSVSYLESDRHKYQECEYSG